MLAGGGLFATLMNGFGNKYQYQVRKIPLSFSNLPPAFKGLIGRVGKAKIECLEFRRK